MIELLAIRLGCQKDDSQVAGYVDPCDSICQMKMPVLFVSHGSPTLPLEPGDTGAAWRGLGEQLPKPSAILMISAHWYSRVPTVSRAVQPETIHDFYGFPAELYELQYPAPGAPEMAQAAALALQQAGIPVQLDDTHGSRSRRVGAAESDVPESRYPGRATFAAG